MNLEVAVIILLCTILVYLALINVFVALFRIFGITKENSKFQVASLVTRISLSSLDNENIANDKTKRKLAILYLVVGNVFSILIIALIVNVFICLNNYTAHTLKNLIISFVVFFAIIIVFNLPFIKNSFDLKVEKRAQNIDGNNTEENIVSMVAEYSSYAIMEVFINSVPKILSNRSLDDAKIDVNNNVKILILKRKNKIIQATKSTVIQKNDLLVVLGKAEDIKSLFIKAEKDMSSVLHSLLSFKKENVVTLIENYGSDAMAEVKINNIPYVLKDKALDADELKEKYNLVLLSLKRSDEIIEKPNGAILELNDTLVVFGSYSNIKNIFLNIE